MQGSENRPIYTETDKKEAKINSSARLAESLGFTRDPQEKPTTYFRTYKRTLLTVPIQREAEIQQFPGLATFFVEDIGKYGEKGEDISVGVEMGGFFRGYSLTRSDYFADLRERLSLPKAQQSSFDKMALKNGGYQEIFTALRELEQSGFYIDLLRNIETELRAGIDLVDTVIIPTVLEKLSGYKILDLYTTSKKIYFYTDPAKGQKPPNAICIQVDNDCLVLTDGGMQINSDKRVRLLNEYTIAPRPSPHFGWHFVPGDKNNAKEKLKAALTAWEELRKNSGK